MRIILLKGFAGSGKDTFGKCFVEHLGFYRFAFADSLKKMVSKKYNIAETILHNQDGKLLIEPKSGKTWRTILLEEARDAREKDPTIFANMCIDDILESGEQNIIITDWRFPNELDSIQKRIPDAFCITVEIRRTDQTISPVNDISEYLLKDIVCDFIIENDGKEDLLPKAKNIIIIFQSLIRYGYFNA